MIKPAGHRVLVKPDAVEEISKGGIVLVQNNKREKEAQITGVIVAIGPNAWKAYDGGEPWAAVGDRVYFAKYGGELIKDGDEELRILNDEDITAVFAESETVFTVVDFELGEVA